MANEEVLTPELKKRMAATKKSVAAPVLILSGLTITSMAAMGKHEVVYDALMSLLTPKVIPVAVLAGGLFFVNSVVSNPELRKVVTGINILAAVATVTVLYRNQTFTKFDQFIKETQNG